MAFERLTFDTVNDYVRGLPGAQKHPPVVLDVLTDVKDLRYAMTDISFTHTHDARTILPESGH